MKGATFTTLGVFRDRDYFGQGGERIPWQVPLSPVSAAGVESADRYADIRRLEVCLGLPIERKFVEMQNPQDVWPLVAYQVGGDPQCASCPFQKQRSVNWGQRQGSNTV